MTLELANAHVKILVKKINVITGWPIPELEEDRQILYSELYKYLLENFPTVNPEEVAHSIRTHGIDIKDWGRNINLNLINQCLSKYMAHRAEISAIEATKSKVGTNTLPEPLNGRISFAEDAETAYQEFLISGKTPKLLSEEIYNELEHWQLIEKDAHLNFESFEKIPSIFNLPMTAHFGSKRSCVIDFFTRCESAGIKQLFVKE